MPWKIKVGMQFSFHTLFIFDFDVCVGIQENLVLKQEVIFRLLQYILYDYNKNGVEWSAAG